MVKPIPRLRSAECASLTTRILHNSPLQSVTGVWTWGKRKNWPVCTRGMYRYIVSHAVDNRLQGNGCSSLLIVCMLNSSAAGHFLYMSQDNCNNYSGPAQATASSEQFAIENECCHLQAWYYINPPNSGPLSVGIAKVANGEETTLFSIRLQNLNIGAAPSWQEARLPILMRSKNTSHESSTGTYKVSVSAMITWCYDSLKKYFKDCWNNPGGRRLCVI